MKKKGIVWQSALVWWILAIAVLVLSLFLYMKYGAKGGGFLDYIRDILRFGG